MLGDNQEDWLFRNLRNSRATWKVLAQQVMMMRWDFGALAPAVGVTPPANIVNVDAWDGYQAARNRVMTFLAANEIQNGVVLTGDIAEGTPEGVPCGPRSESTMIRHVSHV